MQAYQDREGQNKFDLFYGEYQELVKKMDKRKAEIEADGGHVTERRMLTKNSKCPCGSGRAIKRCHKDFLNLSNNK